MRAALYARVSTTRQADNDLSIPDQLRQLRDWCKRNEHDVVFEYVEPGASAMDDKRPVFQEMIADATHASHPFDVIAVHSRSRFFRDMFHSLLYERKLRHAGVKLISISQPTSDDPAGEMVSKIVTMFDEYSSQENSKHTLRAMQENARQGYWNGSQPPFGYRTVETVQIGNRGRRKRRLEVDPAEAETVRRIFQYYLHGVEGKPMGLKAVASYLNDRGISLRGRPWRIQKLHDILTNPVYTGTAYFNRTSAKSKTIKPESEWIAIEVPAIIEAHTFELVRQRREANNPKMRPPRVASSNAPLVGLLKCGQCGANMVQATGKSGQYRYYKCGTRLHKSVKRCDGRNLPRDKVDAQVLTLLADRVFHPERVQQMLKEFAKRRRAADTVENAQLIALRRELDQVTTAQERLYEAVESGVLPADESLRARAQKLKARREDVVLEMAKLKDRRTLTPQSITPAKVEAFCKALRARMCDSSSGLGKAYLHLIVDTIAAQDNELHISGSYDRLATAVDLVEKMKQGEVPSFIPNWRARDDSNLRPQP